MRKFKVDPETTYVSADLHLGHDAEYIYKERGFEDIGSHDRAMERAINTMPAGSTLLHFGDLSYGIGQSELEYKLDPLFSIHGQQRSLMSIEGNRDHAVMWRLAKTNKAIKLAGDLAIFKPGDGLRIFVGSHYPIEVWPQMEFGFLHLHGHTHGKSRKVPGRADVSVDALMRDYGSPIVPLADVLLKLTT